MSREEPSRIYNSFFNIIYSLISSFSLSFVGMASRVVFVRILGDDLMGVNSLFADVLMLFSFAEMGFGTAITFSLYKPIAENNNEKIKSLLLFYRNVYNFAALVVLIIGVCFFPFLGSLKTTIPLNDLRIYYCIFLFNNVISYIAAYRESYISAKQQARRITVWNTIFSVVTTVSQIAVVLITKNFLLYLVINSGFIIIRKVIVNRYILNLFPETLLKGATPISTEERNVIVEKVKALAIQKFANLGISQTDSLIVSFMIGVSQWGLISNYLSLKTTVSSFTSQIFSSVLPSMGDLVARENRETQLNVFALYDFLNAWMHAFFFIALATLSSPLIAFLFGEKRVVGNLTVFLLFANVFFGGLRDPISLLKEANGAFEGDKLYSVMASVVNLVTSLLFVKIMGLPGIFLGTICSTFVTLISRPMIIFKPIYEISPKQHFIRMTKYIVVTMSAYLATYLVVGAVHMGNAFVNFIFIGIIAALLPNIIWIIVFRKDKFFARAVQLVKPRIEKFISRK